MVNIDLLPLPILLNIPTIGIRVGPFITIWPLEGGFWETTMNQQEGISSIIAPLFNGNNYALWRIRMRSSLMAFGLEVWKYVVKGYEAPDTLAIDIDGIRVCNKKSRVVNAILGGLANSILVKVMHCKLSKDIWDKLHIIYDWGYKENSFVPLKN